MINDLALDLRTARRKSGLSQEDCAHLLGVHPSRISLLENGKAMPSVSQICRLSLIYGRSFESLFAGILEEAREGLREQITYMPDAPKRWLGNFNRENTLRALAHRLTDEIDDNYGGEA
ncbi:MAG: helix-turn-helix transcriptional regulator [Pseudomonadota bacterium]